MHIFYAFITFINVINNALIHTPVHRATSKKKKNKST